MKRNHYYCIIQQTKDTTQVIYISTSENACDKVFEKLIKEHSNTISDENYNAFHKSVIDMLGVMQNA